MGLMLSMGQRMQDVLVLAGCAVGAPAGADFDAPPAEVLVEIAPFPVGRLAVFLAGPRGPAAGEELVVGGDDVFVEDRDVAACGPDVEVAEQGRPDVDGQPVEDSRAVVSRASNCR